MDGQKGNNFMTAAYSTLGSVESENKSSLPSDDQMDISNLENDNSEDGGDQMTNMTNSASKDGNRNSLPPLIIPDSVGEENSQQSHSSVGVPSLKGKLFKEKSQHVCRGLWAMSDAAHNLPGQTGEFEFRLTLGIDDATFPASGKYHGWFMLQQPPPRHALKIEDKEINIRFSKNDDEISGYNIEGEGYNKFGKFTVFGNLSNSGELQMYRAYLPRGSAPPSSKNKRPSSNIASPGGNSKSAAANTKKVEYAVTSNSKVHKSLKIETASESSTTASLSSTRESSSRGRRISNFSSSDFDTNDNSVTTTPLPIISSRSSTNQSSKDGGRSQRLTQSLLKCSELLKDLSRQPQSIWFNEPVDYVKLNIPDYPVIVKVPMDIKTIRTNLENNIYESHESFAEHVRLVFRNAIMYNQLRDNPVNIAAREMSNRFEEKYRIMLSNLAKSGFTADYDTTSTITNTTTNNNTSSSNKKKNIKSSSKRVTMGPRSLDAVPPPPPAIDGNLHTIIELQRKMAEMQTEIVQLRTAVRHTEVKKSVEKETKGTKSSHLVPLTLEEKNALIDQIHSLPEDKMSVIIDMLTSASYLAVGATDLEIPLDEIDIVTLRTLQQYVQGIPLVGAPKRRRQTNPNKTETTKRSKKENGSNKSSNGIKQNNSLNSNTSTTPSTSIANLNIAMAEAIKQEISEDDDNEENQEDEPLNCHEDNLHFELLDSVDDPMYDDISSNKLIIPEKIPDFLVNMEEKYSENSSSNISNNQ